MPVQVTLSVEELARLVAQTAMGKDIFAARKKQQAAAAKRKAAGPQELKSPRSQQRENQERARRAGQAEKERLEDLQRKKEEAKRAAAARDAEQREEQRLIAKELPPADEREAEPAQRRAPPPKRPQPPARAPTPPPEVPMPKPSFVEAPTWDSLSAMASDTPPTSIEELKPLVRGSLDTAVLCAPFPDGHIRTWNELLAPAADSWVATDWAAWLSPTKWVDLPRNRFLGNTQNLDILSAAGNYNEVLEVSAATPVDNPAAWPPQLRALGVVTAEDTPLHAVLPRADYVVRMTRMDPFPGQSGALPSYRSMKIDSLVDEMSLALQAASQGIGPPIYAAVAWPWERQPGESEQRYGMILIMRKADGNMMDWSHNVRRMPRHQPDPVAGPSPALRRTVEEAGAFLVGLCFHIGSTQHVNYDIKKGNLLMHEVSGSFYVTDFDAMYYRYIPPNVMEVKGCFFVNLLLLAMHVRAYSDSSTVTEALLGVFSPILVDLWNEALRSPVTFGQGSRWLKMAKIAPTYETGSFDHRELARMEPGPRIGRQLAMMVFEYLFDDTGSKQPPQAAVQWEKWEKEQKYFGGMPPLVPQLLKFSLLYNRPYQPYYTAVFEGSINMAYADYPHTAPGAVFRS